MDLDFDLPTGSSESVCSGESGSGDFRRYYCDEPDLLVNIGAGSGLLPVVKYKLADTSLVGSRHV